MNAKTVWLYSKTKNQLWSLATAHVRSVAHKKAHVTKLRGL